MSRFSSQPATWHRAARPTGDIGSRAGRRCAAGLAAIALVALVACKEQKSERAGAEAGPNGAAITAVEQGLRVAFPGAGVRFRGMQAYAQAVAGRVAVCGQVSPFRSDPASFVPFVAVVAMGGAAPVIDPADQHVATTPSEASRVWLAIVGYCYERGGPATLADRSVMALPPMPDVADPTPSPAAAPAPAAVAAARVPPHADAGRVASGSVTMRQNANLHADAHGPVTRVVPQGTALQVLAEAAGGWLQVGQDGSAWGWVHESMVERH